jgi:hypothetical protein
MCEGQLVHLSVFANGVPQAVATEPPLGLPQDVNSAGQPKQSKGRRPWWRYWA